MPSTNAPADLSGFGFNAGQDQRHEFTRWSIADDVVQRHGATGRNHLGTVLYETQHGGNDTFGRAFEPIGQSHGHEGQGDAGFAHDLRTEIFDRGDQR